MANDIVTRLRPYVLRWRNAEQILDDLRRRLAAAETERNAARQELDDVLVDATKDIR